MKKMLVKAVALSLVLGGVGFAANNAQAAGVPNNYELNMMLQNEAGQRKAQDAALEKKIDANADNIATNKANIEKNAKDIASNKAIATKAYGMAQTEQVERKIADLQIREDMKKADKELSDKIDKETSDRKFGEFKLNTKIDAEGQARVAGDELLNKKIEKETKDREFGEFKLNTKIDAEGQARVENDKILNAKIDKETKDRETADKILNLKVNAEGQARVENDKILNTKIDAETDARKDADNKLRADLNQETIDRVDADNRLQTAIDQKADKTTVAENTAAIESNKAAIAQEKKDREHADQKLQDQITINKGQIENEATNRANEDKRIEAKFDGEVSRLDGRIDQLDANVEKVGAMAAAIANLHTMGYDPEAPTEIAVGVGQYRDKTGLALGAFHYPNRDFMLSFSVSTAGDEFMGGIGATWRFGRKSPEELRQAEVEKAAKAKLAKAEAAKKAAKDARVAAQQKRHAEMLAARTGK